MCYKENIGLNLHELGLGKVFFKNDTNSTRNNRKTGSSTLKIFCVSKDITKKVKKQPNEWEKIFANHISNKRLIPRIYKELLRQY